MGQCKWMPLTVDELIRRLEDIRQARGGDFPVCDEGDCGLVDVSTCMSGMKRIVMLEFARNNCECKSCKGGK